MSDERKVWIETQIRMMAWYLAPIVTVEEFLAECAECDEEMEYHKEHGGEEA
jgi:hypothetical protein